MVAFAANANVENKEVSCWQIVFAKRHLRYNKNELSLNPTSCIYLTEPDSYRHAMRLVDLMLHTQ